ncbi:MAG: undecaprenyldiphospho-muramoylpentapeptide beta-N-acetylglucosaminyltransferase [Alphaproteobacteria bacterium]|nr:undecaprenyldiphospho-muramoylpentapeptide beta-N-acetylglucosaminyltransferase [Alphaproteobacteria bacterium]
MHNDNTPCVLLAAGGTGGHLFPAFALAEELGRRGYLVDLVTDMRGDRYGTGFPARKIHQIPSATLTGKSPVAVAQTVWTLSKGIGAAVGLLGEIRPSVVIGFGGYPTFPPLMAAKLRGIKTALHEQNAVLGRANRLLAARVDAIATSFEHVKHLEGPLIEKARLTGNPVRDVVIEYASRPYWTPDSSDDVKLLIFGGSQGARYFSDTLPPAMAKLPHSLRQRLRVVQQAREEDVERVQQAYAALGISAEVAPFFANLPEIMADSHLVIGRAGASTVSELTVIGRPSILVPLPHAVDNDQLNNALTLAKSGGAWCIEQKDLDVDRLAVELERLIGDPKLLLNAAHAARSQGRPDAVKRLADLVGELAM